MKRIIFFTLMLSLLLSSCKEKSGNLHIVLSKMEKKDYSSIKLNGLYLKKSDSTLYKLHRPYNFNLQDTIKIEKIPIGNYILEYIDILGNKIINPIEIKENLTEVKIYTDSINIEKFKHQIPFINLKENDSYSIEMSGGGGSTIYYGKYIISRSENVYFFESIGKEKRKLNQSEIVLIKKFESELLAINGKEICSSTGRMKFKITGYIQKEIIDNTCNWNGWSNLFSNLNHMSSI